MATCIATRCRHTVSIVRCNIQNSVGIVPVYLCNRAVYTSTFCICDSLAFDKSCSLSITRKGLRYSMYFDVNDFV